MTLGNLIYEARKVGMSDLADKLTSFGKEVRGNIQDGMNRFHSTDCLEARATGDECTCGYTEFLTELILKLN
jgi:hypothetical protein